MQSLVPTEESSLLMHAYAIGLLYHERIRSGYIHTRTGIISHLCCNMIMN